MKTITGISFFSFITIVLYAQTVLHIPGTYATINAALSAANAGDTILIGPGKWSEQLYIKKMNITIMGSGTDKTILQETASNPDSTILYLDSSTVMIRDLQFYGGSYWDGGRRGLLAFNSTTTMRNCAFVAVFNASISALNGTIDIDSVIVTSVGWGAYPVIIDSAGTGQTGNVADVGLFIMNSHFHVNHFTGGAYIDHIINISPDMSSTPSLFSNRIYPVDTTQFTQGTIENSTFYGSRMGYWGQGIRIFGNMNLHRPELIIRNNRFKGQVTDSTKAVPDMPQTAGISFNGWNGYAEIYGNTIQYFNSGIALHGISTASIHDNIIINNGRYGIVTTNGYPFAGQVQPDLGGGGLGSNGNNTIMGNPKYNINNQNSLDVWAMNNNWGTTDTNVIRSTFYDFYKSPSVGKVYFINSLTTGIKTNEGDSKFYLTADPGNSGQLYVRCSENMDVLKVINLSGQIILETRPCQKTQSLFIAKSGVYILSVSTNNKISTKKIIIIR